MKICALIYELDLTEQNGLGIWDISYTKAEDLEKLSP